MCPHPERFSAPVFFKATQHSAVASKQYPRPALLSNLTRLKSQYFAVLMMSSITPQPPSSLLTVPIIAIYSIYTHVHDLPLEMGMSGTLKSPITPCAVPD